MSHHLECDLKLRLQHYRTQQRQRTRQVIDSPQRATVLCSGQTLLSFNSNDYLGLANHPTLIKALQQGARQYGVGSGSSALLGGYSRAHQILEESLAEFVGRDRALVFSSGQLANFAVIASLAQRGDAVLQDRENHASLIDATILSRAKLLRYSHGDLNSLAQRLRQTDGKKQWIASESVFSMSGDCVPLMQLSQLAAQHQAHLIVDDAHGFGCFGPQGQGCLSALQLDQDAVPVMVATLGKACGVSGAFVAGSHTLIDILVQQARQYLYTTAMPPALAVAATASIQLVRKADDLRAKLQDNIQYFKQVAQQLAIPLLPSTTAIQAVYLKDNGSTLQLEQHLRTRDVWVRAIRPPTVPANTARLRVSLTAQHSHTEIDYLLEAIAQWLA